MNKVRWLLVGVFCLVMGPPLLVLAGMHGAVDHARDSWRTRHG